MDTVTVIRIVAATLAIVFVAVLIMRRKKHA